jgi:hypothetical protein
LRSYSSADKYTYPSATRRDDLVRFSRAAKRHYATRTTLAALTENAACCRMAQRLDRCHVVPRQGRGEKISERVKTGLQSAVAKGKTLGSPWIGRAIESKARKILKDGVGMLRIAAGLDIGSCTVQRIAREMRNCATTSPASPSTRTGAC